MNPAMHSIEVLTNHTKTKINHFRLVYTFLAIELQDDQDTYATGKVEK
jgi:hypothetical protein